MRPLDECFLYGRVIDANANPLGVGRGVLVYIYRARSRQKLEVPVLLRDQLLVPPMMTNAQPWTKGYFEHLYNQPLKSGDRWPQHCFRDNLRSIYRDENGNRLERATGPVGQWGLHSFRTIDDEISTALGIPLAPDE